MANTESVDIKIFGQGSHGAAPHMSIDPIVTTYDCNGITGNYQ